MKLIVSRRKRIAKMMIAVVLTLTALLALSSSAFAASWRTGNIPEHSKYTSAITVKLSNKKKDASIKVHGYVKYPWSNNGKEKNCKLHVLMRDVNGKWIWEGDIKTGSGGKKLKLGKDHSVYKIYLKHIDEGVHCWDVGHNCPDFWGVECVSNCGVS